MLIRAVRPVRFITAALKFASDLIGKKVISDNSIDLGSIVKTMSARTPILLLYRDEPENARFLITDLACKRQVISDLVLSLLVLLLYYILLQFRYIYYLYPFRSLGVGYHLIARIL